MIFNYSDFIYENICDSKYFSFFDSLIKNFEYQIRCNRFEKRRETYAEDDNCYLVDREYEIIRQIIKPHLEKYAELVKYPYTLHLPQDCKMQKSLPRMGYHAWHHERNSNKNNGVMSLREFVWILYLNDVEEGGETEFLLQSKRVIPKKGKICIWPSAFTHSHRGNPPLKGVKYLLTSWTFTSNYLTIN